jgi:hypothetical protein
MATPPRSQVHWRVLVPVLLIGLLATVLTPVAAGAAPRYAGEEQRFLDLMNADRRSRGLGDLVSTPSVAAVARDWSQTMAADGTLRHNPNVARQLKVTWTRWGENVGWASNAGGGDLVAVTRRLHRGFMASDGHRANILGAYNQVGVGVATDDAGTMWATMVFVKSPLDAGEPRPAGLTDIAGSSHRAAISAAWRRGLIDACDGARRFCPDRNARRSLVAETVARLIGMEPSTSRRFTDVGGASASNALAEAGIVNGCAPRRFCPDRPVSRAQLAAMLARALDLPASDGGRFTDLPNGYVHTGAINALADAGVTRGCGTGRFCPTGRVTRAQLAGFAIRAVER